MGVIKMNEYIKETIKNIKSMLPEDYAVSSTTTIKNNGKELAGILINNGNIISPVIYINEYYERQIPAEEAARKIYEAYVSSKEKELPFSLETLTDYNKVKNLVNFKLINSELNAKLLADVPYDLVCDDLACVYYLSLEPNATITIHNNLFNQWNIPKEELFKDALQNSLKWDISIKTLTDTMLETVDINSFRLQYGETEMTDEEFAEVFREFLEHDESIPVYVLSSSSNFGASALLRPDILEDIKNRLDSSFIILPSSLYEVLIVPMPSEKDIVEGKSDISIPYLRSMVKEVNGSTVDIEDQLSDNIYYCNGRDIHIIDTDIIQDLRRYDEAR